MAFCGRMAGLKFGGFGIAWVRLKISVVVSPLGVRFFDTRSLTARMACAMTLPALACSEVSGQSRFPVLTAEVVALCIMMF